MAGSREDPGAGSNALRLLGGAFLLQAIGSPVSGLVLAPGEQSVTKEGQIEQQC